jgi:hypothetical protein
MVLIESPHHGGPWPLTSVAEPTVIETVLIRWYDAVK